MPDFIDVAITTDAGTIADAAQARLAANLQANGIVGYVPNSANFEIVLLDTFAAMAADLALAASQVPQAIFRTFGTQLLGLAYNNGATATAASTWTLADTLGHTIPGGTQVSLGAYGFYVESDVIVSPGTSTASVNLVAVDLGTAYNGQSGVAQLVDALDWVTSITASTSSGGADAESDSDYASRLAAQLALQAPRPITASDYAAFTLAAPESIVGAAIGRATAIDGFDPSGTNFTGTTNGTTTVASVSSFAGITVGSIISATDITAGQTVQSINVGASTLLLSAAASGSHTAEAMVATGSYGNERTITVFVTDLNGNAMSSSAMSALQAWLESYREINFLVYVEPPSYSTVYVFYEVHVLPGYLAATVVANVNQALTQYLNPALWGNPLSSVSGSGASTWLNSAQGFNIVRYNKVLGIIEAVPGVDYVPSGSTGLAIGFTPSTTGTSDLTLPGPAPLPQADTTTPTVVGTTV